MAGECVLLVEDDRAVALGLRHALENEGFRVIWVDSAARALECARRDGPRIVLLDIRLPDGSGLDVCRALRSEGRSVPIIMVTALDDELDVVLGLELGADDYVVKPYSLRELVSRIRALLRRAYGDLASTPGSSRLALGAIEIDLDRLVVKKDGAVVELTPTEFRILHHLAAHPGRPISREALIEAVWGFDEIIGCDRTVDVHIRHLRAKIEDDPGRPARIVTVRGMGYKLQA